MVKIDSQPRNINYVLFIIALMIACAPKKNVENHGHEIIIIPRINKIIKAVNSSVVSSIKTIKPIRKRRVIHSNANGVITYDTRSLTSIASWTGGRIEKLYVNYNFQPIHKDQRLFEIYSPELLMAQKDFLHLIKSDARNLELIDEAKSRLKLLGATDWQVEQMVSSGQASNSFSVFSPADGYVVNINENSVSQNDLSLREGMYVSQGETILKVVNAKNVWAEFDVYSDEASLLKMNDAVQIEFEETNEKLKTVISFVQPFFSEGRSFKKIRVNLSNAKNDYRIGQLITASFKIETRETMWIPLSARLDLGMQQVVFVKKQGIFQPRVVVAGNSSGNSIEVLKGVAENDSIAYNAHFMVDSESFIKTKNEDEK